MNNSNSLALPETKDKNRKMTQAIIEDQQKQVYEFLEDDDDFEEFENDGIDYDVILAAGGDI